MPYNAELQALREFFLLIAPRVLCTFCGKPIYTSTHPQSFGHRRHNKIHEPNFCVHHEDEDRTNNANSNLRTSHSSCHKRYHARKRALEKLQERGNSPNGIEKEGRKEGKEDGQKSRQEVLGGGDPIV